MLTAIGIFDWVVVAMVVYGAVDGFGKGVTPQLWSLGQWAVVLGAGAAVHRPVAWVLQREVIRNAVWAHLLGYLLVVGVIVLVSGALRRRYQDRVESSDRFGRMEFRFGAVAGVVRMLCLVVFSLAVLNAPGQVRTRRTSDIDYQVRNYGSAFFPTLSIVQEAVFRNSATGRFVGENLTILLVQSSGGGSPRRR